MTILLKLFGALATMLVAVARWDDSHDRFVEGADVTAVASAARTTSSNSGWLDSAQWESLNLTLAVTAVTGTNPTLDVIVETAIDSSGTSARTVATFAQKTGVASERKAADGLDRFYRVSWTIGGTATPTFTFSVAGDAKG